MSGDLLGMSAESIAARLGGGGRATQNTRARAVLPDVAAVEKLASACEFIGEMLSDAAEPEAVAAFDRSFAEEARTSTLSGPGAALVRSMLQKHAAASCSTKDKEGGGSPEGAARGALIGTLLKKRMEAKKGKKGRAAGAEEEMAAGEGREDEPEGEVEKVSGHVPATLADVLRGVTGYDVNEAPDGTAVGEPHTPDDGEKTAQLGNGFGTKESRKAAIASLQARYLAARSR